MNCRHCNTSLDVVFADLSFAPISNDMLLEKDLNTVEHYYPLKAYVCDKCFLVQLDEIRSFNTIFRDDYTYFSSMSKSWLKHAKEYTHSMIETFGYDQNSFVVEIASNDGYLLQNFVDKKISCLGIEPTENTAEVAKSKGIDTLTFFFSSKLARQIKGQGKSADLIIGNNVLAHVPNINDFVEGMSILLKKNGVITMEFPHLFNLIKEKQFDTIYHEHFSYLSLHAVQKIFKSQGLEIFDVEEIPTHGGSLRIFAKHLNCEKHFKKKSVEDILNREVEAKLLESNNYKLFQNEIENIKYNTLTFLINEKKEGKKIVAYGAASKGNTLLNYCGIKGTDLIRYVIDISPHKQNKYLPGSHIPVVSEDILREDKPDYIIILPWNLKSEISEQLSYIKQWNGKFVTFIPNLEVF